MTFEEKLIQVDGMYRLAMEFQRARIRLSEPDLSDEEVERQAYEVLQRESPGPGVVEVGWPRRT